MACNDRSPWPCAKPDAGDAQAIAAICSLLDDSGSTPAKGRLTYCALIELYNATQSKPERVSTRVDLIAPLIVSLLGLHLRSFSTWPKCAETYAVCPTP